MLLSRGAGGDSYKFHGMNQQSQNLGENQTEPLVKSQNHQTAISLLRPGDEKPILGERHNG